MIANAIVFYNSAILSQLLIRYAETGNEAALELITSTSPVAWRHLLLGGHYTFHGGRPIDLDALTVGLDLG